MSPLALCTPPGTLGLKIEIPEGYTSSHGHRDGMMVWLNHVPKDNDERPHLKFKGKRESCSLRLVEKSVTVSSRF